MILCLKKRNNIMRYFLLFILLSSPTFACETAASDWTGRVWARTFSCDVKKNGPATEIQVGDNSVWQVIGNVGRQIVPGFVWNKNDGWSRDSSKDRVIWEGTAKQSSGPCYADKKSSGSSWDFSNGMRICN
jgi:hypothetical protein